MSREHGSGDDRMTLEHASGDRSGRSRHEAALAALDVLVMTPRNAEGDGLIRELQRTRASVRHCWPVPDSIPAEADVIFCELIPGLPHRLSWLPGQAKAALVVLLPIGAPPLELLYGCAPDAVLARPFTATAVPACLMQAHTSFTYGQRLRSRIDKLDETVRGIRAIERAKSILVETRKIGQNDAYDFIRRQAMDRRVTINAVAAAIIDSHELLS